MKVLHEHVHLKLKASQQRLVHAGGVQKREHNECHYAHRGAGRYSSGRFAHSTYDSHITPSHRQLQLSPAALNLSAKSLQTRHFSVLLKPSKMIRIESIVCVLIMVVVASRAVSEPSNVISIVN